MRRRIVEEGEKRMRRSETVGWARSNGLLVPGDRWRLWVGLGIAVAGPIAVTPLARTEGISMLPGVPFVLAIVVATLFGRMLAAAVSTLVSVIMLDRFVFEAATFPRTKQDVWAFVLFIVVGFVVAQLLVRFDQALQAQRLERERLVFLERAGDAISGSLDVATTLRQLADALVPALADYFSVDLLEDGSVRHVLVVHPDPAKVDLARELQRRFPSDPDSPTGAPAVIRTGEPQLVEKITEEMLAALAATPELDQAIRGLHLRCAMVVPLSARGRTFGALTLIGAETHERYGPEDLRLAGEIADRAALAIDTSRLLSAERQARADAVESAKRSEVLRDITAAFGMATSVQEVLNAMLDRGLREASAVAGAVGIVAEDQRVEIIGTNGYEPDERPYWRSFGLDEHLPMSVAIRERRVVVLSTIEERDRQYPMLAGQGDQRDHALVCLPLLLGSEVIGGFAASYPPGSTFDDGDLTFLRAIGAQCAQAIVRARSVEGERATRKRFDALASVSRALARTLDHEATATTVVASALEHLGGSARLYMREAGSLVLLAEGDRDGVRLVVAPTAAAHLPAGVAEMIKDDAPRLIERLDQATSHPGIVLPLSIAGSTSGVLVVEEPSRDFRRADEFAFAREIRRRMARAMENARLYRERDHVARTLQRSFLPPALPEVPGLELEALFLPASRRDEVGGDFYDVFEARHGRWVALIGDVCGKGVEAATLTGLARHTLRATSEVDLPSEALLGLNRALLREHLDGRFCTVLYVMIDPDPAGGARLTVASAGHPLPQHVSRDGSTRAAGRHGTLLGVTDDPHLDDVELRLEPGEALVLFTDGIVRKHEVKADEPEGLLKVLGSSPPTSATDLRERVEGYVRDLMAGEQDDDVAVLILRAR